MTSTLKLNDLQLILLSTAAQRENGSLLPFSTAAAAKPSRGRKAAEGLLRRGLAAETEVRTSDQVWREDDDRRVGLCITEAGLAVIAAGTAEGQAHSNAPDGSEARSAAATEPRAASKQELLLGLVARPDGATIDELISATGWLPHTTRAAITGLRKRGHAILNDRRDGISRYRISETQS